MAKDRFSSWLHAFDRGLRVVCLVVGSALLGFMMIFGSFNVLVMRKALNSPIIGTEDLLILSLVLVAAISIPFGGFKQSGIGRNLGYDGVLGFTEAHSISGPAGFLLPQ